MTIIVIVYFRNFKSSTKTQSFRITTSSRTCCNRIRMPDRCTFYGDTVTTGISSVFCRNSNLIIRCIRCNGYVRACFQCKSVRLSIRIYGCIANFNLAKSILVWFSIIPFCSLSSCNMNSSIIRMIRNCFIEFAYFSIYKSGNSSRSRKISGSSSRSDRRIYLFCSTFTQYDCSGFTCRC